MIRKMKLLKLGSLIVVLLCLGLQTVLAQHSVARKWNEVLLTGIRNDLARPTVHARNLFHISTAMYDAWAAYDAEAQPFFLGRSIKGFYFPFEEISAPGPVKAAQEEAMSYAAYRLIYHRFQASPDAALTLAVCDSLFRALGYDPAFVSTEYDSGSPAALGNYLADQIIAFGLQDGSNEAANYANRYYEPVNLPMNPEVRGNPFIGDPNHWQPLAFDLFIDQSGNVFTGAMPEFLGPEWGNVIPFSLQESDLTIHERDGNPYWVYHDPGPPPSLETDGSKLSAEYIWGFALVALWSSHLDPADSVKWDISPASIGNTDIADYPRTIEGLRDYYLSIEGGDVGHGHTVNPHTGQPYEPNIVYRGDYTRVLAEFWADGPDSETPPGHWFTILNYVSDHPDLVRKFKGTGDILDPLEWDVKAYFALGGTMHDVAISAWGIKGWYDYVRPVSAIRFMADRGQSTDPTLANYSPMGLPLVDGLIESVGPGDPLGGTFQENIGKIKLKAWRGPDYIGNPEKDEAGVDWILAENWWPYQRPSFVTPPFAGYVSGHSTYSRAAAVVLTLLTGDPFFPGGMGEFPAPKNEFLVFEEGPSEDMVLQWATYRDASDQTSLSRIWGGIHPPADDIPGRLIGEDIGNEAFAYAEKFFTGQIPIDVPSGSLKVYPNPVSDGTAISVLLPGEVGSGEWQLIDMQGRQMLQGTFPARKAGVFFQLPTQALTAGLYVVQLVESGQVQSKKVMVK